MDKNLKGKLLVVLGLAGAALLVTAFGHSPKSNGAPPASTTATTDDIAETDSRADKIAHDSVNENADANPRAILNRPWFDKLPKSRKDETDMWLFFSSGVGLEDKGSYFRSTFDFFELERQKDKLDIVFLHDKKTAQTTFVVKSCDDTPPFDLCLTLTNPVRGVAKLYSWGDDDDMDRFVPWAEAWKRSAQERARKALASD